MGTGLEASTRKCDTASEGCITQEVCTLSGTSTCSEVLGRLSAAFSFWQRLQSFTMYGEQCMITSTCSRRTCRTSRTFKMAGCASRPASVARLASSFQETKPFRKQVTHLPAGQLQSCHRQLSSIGALMRYVPLLSDSHASLNIHTSS